jgi:hypothetical protein
MSNKYIVFEIVSTWVSWPFRVKKIAIFMAHFLATKTLDQRYYAIPFLLVMMLSILVAWPPNIWSEYRSWNYLFASLFQESTRIFEWLIAHSFYDYLSLNGNGFFSGSS